MYAELIATRGSLYTKSCRCTVSSDDETWRGEGLRATGCALVRGARAPLTCSVSHSSQPKMNKGTRESRKKTHPHPRARCEFRWNISHYIPADNGEQHPPRTNSAYFRHSGRNSLGRGQKNAVAVARRILHGSLGERRNIQYSFRSSSLSSEWNIRYINEWILFLESNNRRHFFFLCAYSISSTTRSSVWFHLKLLVSLNKKWWIRNNFFILKSKRKCMPKLFRFFL